MPEEDNNVIKQTPEQKAEHERREKRGAELDKKLPKNAAKSGERERFESDADSAKTSTTKKK